MKVIICEKSDKRINVIFPTEAAATIASIQQIAEKDVPHGLPFWILDKSDIPADREYRDAWEIDPAWGDPDGFGGESNEFDPELLASWREQDEA